MTYVINDMREDYPAIVRHLLAQPESKNARTMSNIRETLGESFVLLDPHQSLPVGTGRKLNLQIGAAEALQLIGGWQDPALMTDITANFKQFQDAGVFHGGYGQRLRTQLGRAVSRLERDPTSRQAVTTIWDPLHDSDDGPRDLPCTITLQWLIRSNQLHAFTYMRSNDVWWGFPYDVFQFTQLQITIARYLGVNVGRYYHFVGSFHLYERDYEAAAGLHDSRSGHPFVDGVCSPICTSWKAVQQITYDCREMSDQDFNESYSLQAHRIGWYRKVLDPFLPR